MEEEVGDEEFQVEERIVELGRKRKGSWNDERVEGKRAKTESVAGGGGGPRAISSLPLAEPVRRYSFESSSTDSSYTGSGPPTPTAYSSHHYRKRSFSSDSFGDAHSSCGSSSPYPFSSQQLQYPPHLHQATYRSNSSIQTRDQSYSASSSSSPVDGSPYTLDASTSRASSMFYAHPFDGSPREDLSRRSSLPWSSRGGQGEEVRVVEGSIDFPHFQHASSTHFNSRPFVQASTYYYPNSSSQPRSSSLFHPSYQFQETRPSSSSYYPHLAGDPYPSNDHRRQPTFQPPPTLYLQRHRLSLQ